MSASPKVRVLVCQECGRSWERPAQRGQLPRRCPDCKRGGPASAVRLEAARAVPAVESAVTVVIGGGVDAPDRCWNCDQPTHPRSECPYTVGSLAPGCCCCRDKGDAECVASPPCPACDGPESCCCGNAGAQ